MRDTENAGAETQAEADERRTLGDIRRDAGLSQSELARDTGLPVVVIQKWESGSRTPSINALQRVAAVLGDAVFTARYGWNLHPRNRLIQQEQVQD